MGFFGTYTYDGSQWVAGKLEPVDEPWLQLDIHDSDITTVRYRPVGRGTGVAYLGATPRTYFEDDSASEPTDVAREAAGLANWWAQLRGSVSEVELSEKEAELAGYLAHDQDPDEIELDETEDVDQLDDAEIFVEVKTAHFLMTLGLPLPDDLASAQGS